MGNSQGGESKELSGQNLIDLLNARSRQGNSHSPDTVTFQGMSAYLNERAGMHSGWTPSHQIERVNRYHDVVDLAKKIGMGEDAGDRLIAQAYKSLNGREHHLEKANIADPSLRRDTPTVNSNAPSNTSSGPSHPEDLKREAITLALNPHSYSSLSGLNTEKLLALDTSALQKVVHADNAFVQATQNYWNLPNGQQQATAQHVDANYNHDLCHRLGLAGQSNSTPTTAFVDGKDALIKAVGMGFDVYGQHSGQPQPDQKALKAFGQVALSVNLELNSSHTLAGRGADTIHENTMAYNPDGHSQQSRHK